MKIICGPASKPLAETVSTQTGFPKVSVSAKIFPDGESYIRLEGDVAGEEIAIIQTTCPPMQDGKLFQLCFMADGDWYERGNESQSDKSHRHEAMNRDPIIEPPAEIRTQQIAKRERRLSG